MARPITPLGVTPDEKSQSQRRLRSSTTTQRDALPARIVLLRAEGRSEAEVAATAEVSVNTVSLSSKRFELGGEAARLLCGLQTSRYATFHDLLVQARKAVQPLQMRVILYCSCLRISDLCPAGTCCSRARLACIRSAV
jgi:hypothetical protein